MLCLKRSTIVAIVLAIMIPAARAVEIDFVYTDAPGTGFFDPTLGAQRQATLEAAADVMRQVILDDGTVTVEAAFANLGSGRLGEGGGFLQTGLSVGYSGPATQAGVDNPDNYTVTTVAVDRPLDKATGAVAYNGETDGTLFFNTDPDSPWYVGIDPNGQGGGQADFFSTALHELCHVFAFSETFDKTTGEVGNTPTLSNPTFDFGGGNVLTGNLTFTGDTVYFRFDNTLTDASGNLLRDLATDAARASVFATPDAVHYGVGQAVTENGGLVPFENDGVHLRESTYGNALMTPTLFAGDTSRIVGDLERAMLADIGYLAAPLGDMDANGAVNGLDIPDFKAALADTALWEANTGRLAAVLGDMNGDGALNGLDIPGFKSALAGAAVPEPATVGVLVLGAIGVMRRRGSTCG
jgi:hypothetical protein